MTGLVPGFGRHGSITGRFQSDFRIEWQDERYSTVEAEEVLIEADMSREDRKKIIDRQAAIVILQRYLDRMTREDSQQI